MRPIAIPPEIWTQLVQATIHAGQQHAANALTFRWIIAIIVVLLVAVIWIWMRTFSQDTRVNTYLGTIFAILGVILLISLIIGLDHNFKARDYLADPEMATLKSLVQGEGARDLWFHLMLEDK